MTFIANNQAKGARIITLLAPHQRLHRGHGDIGFARSFAVSLLDLDLDAGQVTLERASSLVEDLLTMRNEQRLANSTYSGSQRLDDERRDYRLTCPSRQIKEHLTFASFLVARHH